MSIHGKNWNRKKTARLISKNKVRVVLASYRGRHEFDICWLFPKWRTPFAVNKL